MSDSLQPHGLQHTRLSCPSPTPRACSDSCSLSRWCHSTISSSVVPFSSCLQSFPASVSFLMNQFFTSGGQRIGSSASASYDPTNVGNLTSDFFAFSKSSLNFWKFFVHVLLKWKWSRFSRVQPLATPWTAPYQAPASMGFSRQEYCWSLLERFWL